MGLLGGLLKQVAEHVDVENLAAAPALFLEQSAALHEVCGAASAVSARKIQAR